MDAERKHMDIREFREGGYLQEANRRFFHLLGLALEVDAPRRSDDPDQTWRLAGIWDAREDAEGITFSREGQTPEETFTPDEVARARAIDAEILAKADVRAEIFGTSSSVEPLTSAPEPDNPFGLKALLPAERALEVALRWAGCEGDRHRMWVIDQMVRQLTGPDYELWVQAACFGDEGPDSYEWDTGVAP